MAITRVKYMVSQPSNFHFEESKYFLLMSVDSVARGYQYQQLCLSLSVYNHLLCFSSAQGQHESQEKQQHFTKLYDNSTTGYE